MFKRSILSILLAIGAISLIRSTVGQGTDFLVFWKVGRALVEGNSFYNLAQEGGMVFKYPPWIAPFFIPVGLFSFETAKWIWGIFSAACMAGTFILLERRLAVQKRVWVTLAVFYWGLWVIHALDGQIIVPLMCFGLWVMTSEKPRTFAKALLPVLYTAKIFTLYPILFTLKQFLKIKTILTGFLIVAFLSLVTAYRSFEGDLFHMFHAWSAAAASGGQYLDAGQTRGSKNQSLTSFVCRLLEIPSTDTRAEVSIALALFALAYYFFRKRVKGRSDREWFLMGLALTPVFHPLPWHHLYLFTFPFACLAVQRWLDQPAQRKAVSTIALFTSLVLITLSSERAFGLIEAIRPIGKFLEWNVGRAWGALLLVAVFTRKNFTQNA